MKFAVATRCKQHLFSVSLSPPENEDVPVEVFDAEIVSIEEKMGLTDRPRMVIFHEKKTAVMLMPSGHRSTPRR